MSAMNARQSWKRACTASVVVHCLAIGIFSVFLGGVLEQQKQTVYTIDLDMSSSLSSGSGHAGGGGSAFPEPLKAEEVAAKTAAVQHETPSFPDPYASEVSRPATVSNDSAAAAAERPRYGDGGSGGGTGGGEGSGSGTGTGSGQGYGEGSGSGQGSGNSGASGTGSSPFDVDGFWAALNSNKQYPYMAVRRGIQGTVTLAIALDGDGNLMHVSVASSSGNSMLDEAAIQAAQASCPYPNASGQPVSINTTVVFRLQ